MFKGRGSSLCCGLGLQSGIARNTTQNETNHAAADAPGAIRVGAAPRLFIYGRAPPVIRVVEHQLRVLQARMDGEGSRDGGRQRGAAAEVPRPAANSAALPAPRCVRVVRTCELLRLRSAASTAARR